MVDVLFGLAMACLGLAALGAGWLLQLTHPNLTLTRKEN